MANMRYIPHQGAVDSYYGKQSGRGEPGYFFAGPSYQRGHGIGGLFGKLFRAAVPMFKSSIKPMLKKGAKAVAKEALTTGVSVANDMLDGRSGSESVKAHLPMAAGRLRRRGVKALKRMINQPNGSKRKKRRSHVRRRVKISRKTIKGNDIFG